MKLEILPSGGANGYSPVQESIEVYLIFIPYLEINKSVIRGI